MRWFFSRPVRESSTWDRHSVDRRDKVKTAKSKNIYDIIIIVLNH